LTREEQLVDVARWIARFLDRHPSTGPQDEILIRRRLHRILNEYDDIVPLDDADKRAWMERTSALVR
jgi:hypothetical protein